MNDVKLIGFLGQKPTNPANEDAIKMAVSSLATNEVFTDKHGVKREETHWHNIVWFGVRAELAIRSLDKGMKICVSGSLKYRKFLDKSGVEREVSQIVVEEFYYFKSKSE